MSYFGTIYADTELPSRAKAVYMYLRDRSDAEGKCWPGIKTIASDMRLSRSTVKRALHDLERHVETMAAVSVCCTILGSTPPVSKKEFKKAEAKWIIPQLEHSLCGHWKEP